MADYIPLDVGNQLMRGMQFKMQRDREPINRLLMQGQVESGQLANQAQRQALSREQFKEHLMIGGLIGQSVMSAKDPQEAEQLYNAAVQNLAQAGYDMADAEQFSVDLIPKLGQAYKMAKSAGLIGGANGQQGARIGQYNPGDYTPESWSQFVKNPSDPSVLKRYETSVKGRLYTSPDLADRAAEVEGNIAASKAGKSEQAKSDVQLEMKPKIEAATKSAVELAKQMADEVGAQKSNNKAMSIYQSAIDNLFQSLGRTATGVWAGWAPAISDDARIAEGSIAVMAPVLKEMFRVSGEGTFTKDDQDRLMAMLPSRKDSPAVRAAKLDAVDLVVRAKLSQGEAGATFTERQQGGTSIEDLVNKYAD